MSAIVQHLTHGLVVGSLYGLIALGYTLVFGVLRLINFAHGEVLMVGAYVAYFVARACGIGPTDPLPVAVGALMLASAMVGSALLGLAIERVAYRPLRSAPRMASLITAIGVSMFLQYGAQLVFGAEPKFFPQPGGAQTQASSGVLDWFQLSTGALAVALAAGLQWIVYRSRVGLAVRAVSFSPRVAALQGIAPDRVIAWTFALGSALAGGAGVLLALTYPKIDPLMGVLPGLKAFVAAVIGGIGSVPGALVGALVLGLTEECVVAFGYSSVRDAAAFVFLILVLLVRPQGLLGRALPDKV